MKTRKILSMLLALAMIAALFTVPAFASSEPSAEPTTETPAFVPNIDFSRLPAADTYKIAAAIAQKDNKTEGGTEVFSKFTEDIKSAVYIDISAEKLFLKLPEGVSIAAYSLDGGTKWKTGSIGSEEGADISKLLNKDMTLVLTTSYDKKAKGATAAVAEVKEGETVKTAAVEAATVITFPAIKARPKADKLVVNYLPFADTTGKTTGQWTLTAKEAEFSYDAVSGLQLSIAKEDKKTPLEIEEGKSWGYFKSDAGINIQALPSDEKVAKSVYLIRTEPKTGEGNWQPASKPYKVTATSEIKAPKMKADYKKELVKAKFGLSAYFGTYKELKEAATVGEYNKDNPDATIIKNMDKETAKAGISISAYLTEERQPITMWMAATTKKPASAKQEVSLAARAYLNNYEYTPLKGKIKLLKEAGQTHEVLKDEATNKYGTMPKVEGNTSLKVRAKATAKGGKEDDTTFAASQTGALNIAYGVYNPGEKSEKKGITSAVVVAPNYPGVLVSRLVSVEAIAYGDEDKVITFNVGGLIDKNDIGTVGTKVVVAVEAGKTGTAAVVGVSDVVVAAGENDSSAKVTAKLEGLAAGTDTVSVKFTVADDAGYVPEARAKRFSQAASVTVAKQTIELNTAGLSTSFDLNADNPKTTYTFKFDKAFESMLGTKIKLQNSDAKELDVTYEYTSDDDNAIAKATINAKAKGNGKLTFTLVVDDANYAASATKATFEVSYTVILPDPQPSAQILSAFLTNIGGEPTGDSSVFEAVLVASGGKYTIPRNANLQVVSVSPAGVAFDPESFELSGADADDIVTVTYKTKGGTTSDITFSVKYTLS